MMLIIIASSMIKSSFDSELYTSLIITHSLLLLIYIHVQELANKSNRKDQKKRKGNMVRRNAVHAISSHPSRVWWPQQRRKGKRAVVRLGNRRRGFLVGPPRMVVQRWRMNIGKPVKMMRSIILGIISNGGNLKFLDAYLWSLPILRPQLFPLC